ncbi:lipoate--protein ligase [Clostridium aciditolerans]|uniref:lipoate--protein ligase n=1 Tax=Clostridium aciditolerans TaxID=339861 RepID=A0A934I200_9CLOT|nr:lipoate--protein ligase [Clostridium aciditolerans]MBI6873566.1 lipoate--protein ligase [Clostridium aciditolerans]
MLTKDIKTKIVISTSVDPYYNLSLEEYMLNNVEEDEVILYLWQNANTVVIGRNQNPWKECKCKELELNDGKIARRLSGGGAVYHDLGNLNFTFVASEALYNLEKQLKVILKAAQKEGIDAQFSGRNDIEVNGKKFSGNAFYFTKTSAYHHGAILIDTDISKLGSYLQVSKEKIQSKGIDSVQARVVNLKNLNKAITIESFKMRLKESFKEIYGENSEEYILNEEIFKLNELYNKYSSWEWIYGESPSFDISFKNRFTWGDIEIGLTLKKAYIQKAVIYSDALNSSLILRLGDVLEGINFDVSKICEKIRYLSTEFGEDEIINDIYNWMKSKVLQF